ncbi:MAG TPA: formyltetrahydrofolate deformylase, partial [Caulobacteraceae bacterium]|nr:formyltetrahydrofolate deformylase [Caulobacteraceae bacterium]
MTSASDDQWILTCSCPDVAGVLARTTTFLFERGAFLADVESFSDRLTARFFMRIVFSPAPGEALEIERIQSEFEILANQFAFNWAITDARARCPTVIAVSKFGHCLNDLLHRWSSGELPIDIRAVISNHETMRDLVEWHQLPFHHFPMRPDAKPEQEAKILGVLAETGAELLVLARYMQILSEGMSARLAGRCINIHHSFLPGFKGAKPYHQAYSRGVKIIGATAHYVTEDLDEGPIIEQAVERVDHKAEPRDLEAIGRDMESVVLARAVKWHAERRIIRNGART